MSVIRYFLCSLTTTALMLVIPARAYPNVGIPACTVPSAEVTLSFVEPGRIAGVYFKEGDEVKSGNVLVQMDDASKQVRLAQLETESNNLTNILAAETLLAQKQVYLKKIMLAAQRNAATELEVEYAKLDARIAELSLKLATIEREQSQKRYEEAKLQVDNMRLKAPMEGSIERIDVAPGESVNALDSVARIVCIDPLWIDVAVPVVTATSLKCGNRASVQFPIPDMTSVDGRIVFIGAVADAASGTLRVRVEVANKSRRPAGEHVSVSFPPLQDDV